MESTNFNINLMIRYSSLGLILALFAFLPVFEWISIAFSYIMYILLKLVFNVQFLGMGLYFTNYNLTINMIRECIAPSAYILFSIIFLSIPLKNLKYNFELLIKSYIIFTVINFIRIFLLILIHLTYGNYIFNQFHFYIYSILGSLICAIIVLYLYKKYNLRKKIPVYTDIITFIK
jgi:hypothetical protein